MITTDKIFFSAFRDNVVNEMNYGDSLKALCCLLATYGNVSIRKTGERISSLTDGMITISTGTISGLSKELRAKTNRERTVIINRLMKSPSLHNDATSIRISGERCLTKMKEYVISYKRLLVWNSLFFRGRTRMTDDTGTGYHGSSDRLSDKC